MNGLELKSLGALVTAFVVVAALGPFFIPLLHRLKFGQSIRDVGPASHMKKSGTPTMGGIMIFIGILVAVAVWCQLSPEIIVALLLTLGYGLIGFLDDYIKVVMKRNLGLTAKQKFALQILLACIVLGYVTYKGDMIREILWLPGTSIIWDIGWGYYVLAILVLVGTTNAVNLTDGLDGLVSCVSIPVFFAYFCIALILGPASLSTFAVAVLGSCIGFLVHNHYPAKVFMGDTGSLALGGAVAALALLTHTELLLIVVGIVYVLEAASVIIQVAYFKHTGGKRIFRMTPIHHHFELGGWRETKVVAVFTAVSMLGALAGVCLAIWPVLHNWR
jgi:phospho-N-acetylmuramoyl-pentapeptide-transferase